jgi:hypothetical protein
MAVKDSISRLMGDENTKLENLNSELRMSLARISGFNASLTAIGGDESGAHLHARLLDKITREMTVVQKLEQQITDCKGRLAAFEETLKIIQKSDGDSDLRSGTQLEKVREVLRSTGAPMSLNDILKALSWEGDEKKRNSLRGSLSGYAKEGRVFTKESAPDTFGLIEFKSETDQNSAKPDQ